MNSTNSIGNEMKVWDAVKNWAHRRHEDVCHFLTYYELFMMFVVLIGTAVEVATTYENIIVTSGWHLTELEMVFLGSFAFECALKIVAEGRNYFKSLLNVLDISITLSCVLELVMEAFEDGSDEDGGPTLNLFRVLKIVKGLKGFKVFRIFRIFQFFEGFKDIWYRLYNALVSISGLLLATSCKCLMFSIIFRVFFGDTDPEGFGSMQTTTATLFQLLTLDNWMDIYYTSRDNGAPFIAFFLVLFILIESLIFFNLTFTVFVGTFLNHAEDDNALESQEEDEGLGVYRTESQTELSADKTSGVDYEERLKSAFPKDEVGERTKAVTIHYLQSLETFEVKHQQIQEVARVQSRFTEFMYDEHLYPYEVKDSEGEACYRMFIHS